jgi:PAS domain S-box-containing protein
MNEQGKTKEELFDELLEMQHRIDELEAALATFRQREEAGQEAEATTKAMIEPFDGFIYVCSPNYEVEFMNERFIQRTGHDPTGEKCYQAIHDIKEVCPWCVNERVQNGETVRWEVQSPKDNRWYYVVNTPVRHRDGTTYKMAVSQDVTERKQAEEVLRKAKDELETKVQARTSELESIVQRLEIEISVRKETEAALRESEQRFRAVFENNHVVMFITDPETGRIEDASPGACAFYGYDREELKRKELSQINMLSQEQLHQRMQEAKSQQHRYFDFQHRLASGEVRDVEVCAGPISIDGRTLLFSVITDVTDRKRAEQALRESEEQYRAVFDNAGIGINVVDRDMRLIQANPALLNMLGYTDEELRRLTLMDIIHPDDRASTREKLDALMRDLIGPYRIEKHYVRKDGSLIWGDLSASPIRDRGGKPRAAVGVIADITERKRTEEALRKSEQRYRALFDESRDGVWLNARNGLLVEANQAFLDLFGLTREEARHWNVIKAYRDPAD